LKVENQEEENLTNLSLTIRDTTLLAAKKVLGSWNGAELAIAG
jgi:hypothetical protein